MSAEELFALWGEAEAQPEGPLKVSLLEEAVRRADTVRDLGLQFDLRLALTEAAFMAGEAAKMINTLAWCLGTYDREPGPFDNETLLWCCKFAMSYVSSFPNISLEQIEQLLADVEHRYRADGYSPRPVYVWRCFNAFWTGDHDRVRELYSQIWKLPTDALSDDHAFYVLFQADYWLHMGEDERAIAAVERDLHNRREWIYPWVASFILQALLRTGQSDRAAELQRQCYRYVRENPKHVEHMAHHINASLARGELDHAVTLYQRHHTWAIDAPPRQEFEFLLAGWGVCRHLINAGQAEQRITVPAEFTWAHSPGTLPAAEFEPQIGRHVRQLAARFNERNGNDYFDRLIEKFQRLQDLSP